MWKPIAEFDGRYEVSDTGEVRSVAAIDSLKRFHPSCILALGVLPSGYKQARLRKWGDRKGYRRYVHRLVAEAFIPKPMIRQGRLYVNHINGDKGDNRVENLEWCTALANNLHAVKTGLRPTRFSDHEIRTIRLRYKQGATYALIAEAYGVTDVMIGTIIRGETYAYVEGHRDAAHRPRNQGKHHGLTSLDADAVREIRRRIEAGDVQRRIAEDFGVCYQTITNIKQGKVWGHVD